MAIEKKEVVVLRYGHRLVRDERVTPHCCLVARAFGAEKILIEGDEDGSLKTSIDTVVSKWGGTFALEFIKSWKNEVEKYRKRGFFIAHLTAYGFPLDDAQTELKGISKLLVIIGSQKVERAVYDSSDLNISIGQQPHSEIAALAVFLDRFFSGKELDEKFEGASIQIVPQRMGKKVLKN